MIVTWWTASGIIIHHWSIASELSIYCSSLIYFSIATVTTTTKTQKHLSYFCYRYHYYHTTFATKYFATDIKFPGVIELTTQQLILENILWLPLCRINKFGLNTLPLKTVAIPYTCGLSGTSSERLCLGHPFLKHYVVQEIQRRRSSLVGKSAQTSPECTN